MNIKVAVFTVSEKSTNRVDTHTFFSGKYNVMLLKGISPFKMHKIIYFPRKPENILSYTSELR